MKKLLFLLLIPALSFGATIKNDTFTETSNTNLESHTSDSSGGWQVAGTALAQVLGATDVVQATTTSVETVIGDEAPTETDYYVQMTCVTGGTASTDRCGVVLRADGGATHAASSSSYYFFRISGSATDQGWNAFRVDSGSPTVPSGCTLSGTLSGVDTDDPVKLKATVTGTGATVTFKVEYDANIDGGGFAGSFTTLETCSDSDANRITTAGNVGVYLRDTNSTGDDFIAEDFTGGATVNPMTGKFGQKLKGKMQ